MIGHRFAVRRLGNVVRQIIQYLSMPRTITEPHCNLTLTRAQWSTLIGLLERNRTPQASAVVQAIRAALRDDPEAARVSIDRECQKWIGVVQLVFKSMPKALYEEIRTQTQAAETADF